MKLKRLLAAFAAAAMASSALTCMPAWADDEPAAAQETVEYTDTEALSNLPESDELEEMYLTKLFYGDQGISMLGDWGREQLTGADLGLYNSLRSFIEAVAAGQKTDATATVTFSGNSFGNVIDHLLADCPESFYWYDKTEGMRYVHSGNSWTFKFSVAKDYAPGNASGGYTVDTSKIKAAQTAIGKAQTIVSKYAGKTDAEKVYGYAKEIMALVAYNDAAAAGGGTDANGINPWQLVWVFDGDDSTSVVCEGYSKAFQYLCDMGGVDCYTVSGTMNGVAHMWNIAVIDGKSYAVDVTNCDTGNQPNNYGVGYPDKIILKGMKNCTANGFTFSSGSKNYAYVYKTETKSLYSSDILTVSDTDYAAGEPAEIVITLNKTELSLKVGESSKLTASVTPQDSEIPDNFWSSSDPDVASVGADGTVTALKEGTATITAAIGKAKAECVVTVSAADEPDDPNTPDNPDDPNTPDNPDNPNTPDNPDTPDTPDTPSHTHTFGTEWKHDGSYHWHECTAGDGAMSGASLHSFGAGVTVVQPTESNNGTMAYTCSVCGYTRYDIIPPVTKPDTPDVPDVPDVPDIPGYGYGRPEVSPITGGGAAAPAASAAKVESESGNNGWGDVAKEIKRTEEGTSVTIDMKGTSSVDKRVLEQLKGKDIDLVLKMNDEIQWTINGTDVDRASNVNMEAKLNTSNIPEETIADIAGDNDFVQLSLKHSGKFGFKAILTVELGIENDGMFANLYYYNPKTKAMEYIDCGLVTDGKADIDFSHASDYAIILTRNPMGEYEDVSAAAGAVSDEGVIGNGAVYGVCGAVLVIAAAAAVALRKRTQK